MLWLHMLVTCTKVTKLRTHNNVTNVDAEKLIMLLPVGSKDMVVKD
jgi:hypothetical protein